MMKKIPPLKTIFPVYALIVFLTYGWSLAVTFWKLPSWLLYMTLGDIAVAFCYIFTFNFVESLTFLIGLLGLSLLLPARFLRERFTERGAVLTLFLAGSAMLHLGLYANADLREDFIISLPIWWGATLALTMIGLGLSAHFKWLEKALADLADRTIVFLYIFLPLTLIALLVIVVRNFMVV